MNDPMENPVNVTYELESLKSKASLLGIQFPTNIGIDALREKINNHAQQMNMVQAAAVAVQSVSENQETARQRERRERAARYKQAREEATRLVRVQITCMNPAKADLQGEIFTVSNRVIGTVRRHVPFKAPNGWHVERILLDAMRERRYQQITVEKNKKGSQLPKSVWVPEFAIQELPDLTDDQIDRIARKQMAEAGIENETEN